MERAKSQITHYVPEWVLRKFRAPLLYELDITTGSIEIRGTKNAGSGRDLWPGDIEDELSEHDNAAARIYRERIHDQQCIRLNDNETTSLAMWLANFYVRSPRRVCDVDQFLQDENYSREGLVQDLYSDPIASIERIRAQNPDEYARDVERLGEETANRLILDYYAYRIRTAPDSEFACTTDIRHHYMRTASIESYAGVLLKYQWRWLYSHYGFVISDDPLVSWHVATNRWGYGIARPGVEVTIPLSRSICISLEQERRKHPNQLQCLDKWDTHRLNCRQRCSAIKYVYGNSPEQLDFIRKPLRF
jgi:hypothetical protein